MLTQFNASLSLIPDNEYFALIETYLGKVPTPFHKPQLNHALASFFAKEEIVDKIVARIDSFDSLLINTLIFVESLSENNMCDLFSDSYPYNIVISRVINLEERLIFLPDPIKNHQIIINPILKDVFILKFASLNSLFDGKGDKHYKITSHVKYFIQAILSFQIHSFKEKKKKENVLIYVSQLFHLKHVDIETPFIQEIFKGILIYTTKIKEHQKIDQFLQLDSHTIIFTLLNELSHTATLPFTTERADGNLSHYILAIEKYINMIPITSIQSFRRLLFITSFLHGVQITDIDKSIQLFHFLGIFEIDDDRWNTSLEDVIDTDFTITVHPSLSHFKQNNIHYYAQLTSYDQVITYTISKQSIFTAFDNHLTASAILQDIGKRGNRVSKILEQQIEHFQYEYQQVQIYDGLSVCVSERLEKIIENYQPLAPFIIKKIAPKVFLFSRENEQVWRDEFIKIGLTSLPAKIEKKLPSKNFSFPQDEDQIESIHVNNKLIESLSQHKELSQEKYIGSDEILLLKKEVAKRFSSGSLHDELIAKIEQKIIISSSQIIKPSHINANSSASGFDFNKKNLVIKNAMDHKSLLLEISMLDNNDKMMTVIGHPIAYNGNDHHGSIVLKSIPENKEIIIQIQKIFLIKSVKKSIFFKF